MRRPLLTLLSIVCFSISLPAQNVGIGTASPAEKLHVAGNVRVDFLAGPDTRLVASDANGSLLAIASGTVGQVLTQTVVGPAWTSSSDWTIDGNAGTSLATNFIGTTDAAGLAFRINNAERARFTPSGLFCINGIAPLGTDQLSAYGTGNQWAVNGYTSGNGDAGFFYTNGTGSAVVGQVIGNSGSAAEFLTLSAAPSISPTVYIYNGSATVPVISLRTDVASPAAHGISLDINGASSHRGIQVDMDAASTGVGIAVLQYGLNHALSLQSFNPAVTQTAFLSDQAGAGRSIASSTYSATHTSQTGYFFQGSTGIIPATYSNATAVWGQANGIRGGAFLASGPSSSTTVLQALYNGVPGNYDGVGVFGVFQPNPNYGYGVLGQGNWYGVYANGNLGASGVKSFMIDHPLDPENKYLRHFSMESPEVLNYYRGTALLNANGEAVIQLPAYFQSINQNISYHLTPVGAPTVLYVATEMNASGEFKIAGGNPGQKICWNVVADRNDAFVQQNPQSITVEPVKRAADQGHYLQPELYGQPKEKGTFERYKVEPEKVQPSPSPEKPVDNEIPLPQVKQIPLEKR
jgi:hypothetical protein